MLIKEAPPGVIPNDHRLIEWLISDETSDWKALYRFFKSELPLDRGKHYYDNVEWITIKMMLNDDDFYKESELSIREDIWNQMEQRQIINEPEYAFRLIKNRSFHTQPEITAKRTHQVQLINETGHSDAEVRRQHFEKHKEHYSKAEYLKYNRWGAPLF